MNCPSCGVAATPGASFCTACGANLAGTASQVSGGSPAAGSDQLAHRIENNPAFSLAVVTLEPGQSINAEAGAMVSMSANIQLSSEMKGGLMGALKRSVLGGESMFMNTFTAAGGQGEVTLAPSSPGDIVALETHHQLFYVQSGSYLASHPEIEMDTKFGGAKSFFAGEGLFLLRLQGNGLLLLSSFGSIFKRRLRSGEHYVVDTGHIVAFEGSAQYSVRKASQQGLFRSLVSGEGLVAEFEGPGDIFIQTRNLRAFAQSIIPFLPKQRDS